MAVGLLHPSSDSDIGAPTSINCVGLRVRGDALSYREFIQFANNTDALGQMYCASAQCICKYFHFIAAENTFTF